jgi:hypothetical protein
MKNFYCLIFFGIGLVSATAADVETRRAEELGKRYEQYQSTSGIVYRDVRITKITDAGVSIIHAEGVARLGFEELSPEQRTDFGITKEGATQFDAKEMDITAAYKAKVEEQQKAKRQNDAKYIAALLEAERLAAEKALREKNERVATIESTGEIPVFPTITGSDGGFYQTRRHSRYRSTYQHGGGYPYPVSYGYYPRYYHNYYPARTGCNTHYGSIFHFTIK